MLGLMAGQPNRRAREDVPPRDPGGRATPIPGGAGLGSYEIDHAWGDTDDPRILKDRLRRRKAQVEKLKQDRADLKVAMKLKSEEAYNEGLLSAAPKLLEIDKRIVDLTDRILNAPIGEDELKLLKPLLLELSKMRDRLYGKTRQRVDSTSLSASVDVGELMRRGRGVELPSGDAPMIEGEVLDAEVCDE